MARQINAGETKVGRFDGFLIDPRQVVLDMSNNGRAFESDYSRNNGMIQALMDSFKEHGQLQAVDCHPMADKRLKIDAGFHRYFAALYLTEDSVLQGGEPFPLKVIVTNRNDEEAFLVNLEENLRRRSLSPIDNAFNIRKLRTQYGKSTKEIAEKFSKSPAWVSQTEKLLLLSRPVQEKIHIGKISASDGYILADTPEEKRAEVLKGVAEGDGEEGEAPEPGAIRKAAREAGTNVGGLKLKEFRELCQENDGPASSKHARAIFQAITKVIAGEMKPDNFIKSVERNAKEA
jgi:ParB/RepB/Spo0J family partition protein